MFHFIKNKDGSQRVVSEEDLENWFLDDIELDTSQVTLHRGDGVDKRWTDAIRRHEQTQPGSLIHPDMNSGC